MRIAISGMGAVSAAGVGVAELWAQLLAGQAAIGSEPFERMASGRLPVARVSGFELSALPPGTGLAPPIDPTTEFALGASDQAWQQAGLEISELDPYRVAVLIGTAVGGKQIDDATHARFYRNEGKKRLHPLVIPKIMVSAPGGVVSTALGAKGPNFTTASACASASHALISAAMLIEMGYADVVVAGGTESPFAPALMSAWHSLGVLATETCRPFSSGRNGMVLGEGACTLVLESETHLKKRGGEALAFITGAGMTGNAGNIVAPAEAPQSKAIEIALQQAGGNAIDYIHAHGTGTQSNDRAEVASLRAIWGDTVPPVSSVKSQIGHTLGAAGVFSAAVSVMAMREQVLPPTLNFTSPADDCPIDCIPNTARQARCQRVLVNAFGFGGTNAVLVLARD